MVQISVARRHVKLAGTVAALSAAFGTQLQNVQLGQLTVRARSGPLTVPAHLDGRIVAVLGMDNRPQAKPHFRIAATAGAPGTGKTGGGVQPRAGQTPATFAPPELAQIYGFPAGDGTGECIAIIELGGGYKAADIKTWFTGLGLQPPTVTAIAVDHGKNRPAGDPSSADGEVLLDIEVAGGIAPGAKLAVYFCPNTSQGFTDAISTAIHDEHNNPSVVSISWGGAEETWTQQTIQAMDDVFQDAAALGVTVLVASGDDGSADDQTDGKLHVDFPASSPNVVACGGTRLTAGAGQSIGQQTVWNDGAQGGAGGGGISRSFPVPSYQAGAQVPAAADDKHVGRGVPDVSGNADPDTGYTVRVDGQDIVVGGTSAVAPLYSGLVARLNQQLAASGTKVGFVNPVLYGSSMVPGGYSDVVSGNNNVNGVAGTAYQAGPGWDPASGWGSIDGAALLAALSGAGGSGSGSGGSGSGSGSSGGTGAPGKKKPPKRHHDA